MSLALPVLDASEGWDDSWGPLTSATNVPWNVTGSGATGGGGCGGARVTGAARSGTT